MVDVFRWQLHTPKRFFSGVRTPDLVFFCGQKIRAKKNNENSPIGNMGKINIYPKHLNEFRSFRDPFGDSDFGCY